jgi:hypothetical protein
MAGRAGALWARADLRHRWTSSILLALLVAVPVGATLALVAGARRAGDSVERFVASTDLGDIVVFLDGPSSPPPEIAADPRIARVGRSAAIGAVPAPLEVSEFAYTLVGSDDAPLGGLGQPMLLAGRYPERGNEILVNERAAETYGLAVGTRTPVHAIADLQSFEKIPLGEAEVVGITRLPFDLVDDPSTHALIVGGPDFGGGMIPAGAHIGTILLLHLHDPADALDVVADVSTAVENGDVDTTSGILESAERAAELQRNALLVAATIVSAAGVLAIVQAIARHLAPRREDADVLAAIGLTPAERRHAALLSLGPALTIGAVFSMTVAWVLSPLFPLGLARRADPVHGLRPDWHVLLIGLAVATVVVWVCAAMVVQRWVRPRSSDGAVRTAAIARHTATLGLRPSPSVGCHLALASGRGRTRLPVVPTLAVLAASAAVVVGALSVRSSLVGLAGDAERYGQPWDVFVDGGDEPPGDTARQLVDDRRVVGVDAVGKGEVDVHGADGAVRQIGTIGLEGVTGPMWLAALDGRAPAEPGEIALGSTTMRALGLELGEQTTISGPCGERRVEVVGRVAVPLLSDDDPDSGSVLPLSTFDELCAGELIGEIDRKAGAIVRLDDDADVASFVTSIRERQWAEAITPVPSSVGVLADVRQVPLMVAAVIGSLWLLVGTHAMLLAVRRRGGDLAVLRALGMRAAEVRRAVVWQAVAIGVVTICIGIPAGLILGRVTWTAIARPANVLVHVDVAPAGLAALAGAAIALLVTAAVWPGIRAARLRVNDVLRSD